VGLWWGHGSTDLNAAFDGTLTPCCAWWSGVSAVVFSLIVFAGSAFLASAPLLR
jgi:hypothetical protein